LGNEQSTENTHVKWGKYNAEKKFKIQNTNGKALCALRLATFTNLKTSIINHQS
jgi:hypothetical protein